MNVTTEGMKARSVISVQISAPLGMVYRGTKASRTLIIGFRQDEERVAKAVTALLSSGLAPYTPGCEQMAEVWASAYPMNGPSHG